MAFSMTSSGATIPLRLTFSATARVFLVVDPALRPAFSRFPPRGIFDFRFD